MFKKNSAPLEWMNELKKLQWGGSPGLVVKGGDSQSEGREFESQHRILPRWKFFHIILL